MKSAPLFFASGLAGHQVELMIAGVIEALPVDTLDFPEGGGDVPRELGVPFLAGMDEIQVTEASLRLRAKAKPIEAEFNASNPSEGGTSVSLSKQRRVNKLQIKHPDPGVPEKPRTVLRSAGADLKPGPPIFADPDFDAPGDMFPRALSGMNVTDVEGGGKVLTFPPQLGTVFVVQLATGTEATKLSPMAVKPEIQRVVVDGLPENLTVVLAAGAPVTLWNHPGLLFPESEFQTVSFLPLAQKHLSSKLKNGSGATLTVPLNFHSDSGCQVEVTDQKLQAEYRVPLIPDPLNLQLRGGWTPIKVKAPAGRRPMRATADITAKLLGRVLNDASPTPPIDLPGFGMGLDQRRQIAASRAFAPLAGQAPGSVLPLASVRVLAAAMQDTEAVLEVRSDVSGVPGSTLTASVAAGIKPGPADWIEFVFPKPLLVSAGSAPLWVALRVTRGELLWFAGAPGGRGTRFSEDKGKTWAVPDPRLTPVSDLWVQLFHQHPDPQPPPIIQLRYRNETLSTDLMGSAVREGDREFRAVGATLPVFDVLAATQGTDRVDTVLYGFSPAAADLSISHAVLAYDPFGGGS